MVRQDATSIIASAAAGDEYAFRRLIAEHHGDMHRVYAYVTGEGAIAEEATQAAWTIEDGVPVLEPGREPGSDLTVDGDGTLWIAAYRRKGDGSSSQTPGPLSFPNGVLSFDGTTWRQYLADGDFQQVEAAGGYGWALDGAGSRGDGLHLITPEAVATAE